MVGKKEKKKVLRWHQEISFYNLEPIYWKHLQNDQNHSGFFVFFLPSLSLWSIANSLQCLARTKFRISNQNTLKINKIKIIWGGNTYGLVIDLKCKCNFFLMYCTLVKMNSANDCVISIICSPRMCSLLEVLIQKHCARLKRSGNVFHNTLEDLTNCWPAYHHHENQN